MYQSPQLRLLYKIIGLEIDLYIVSFVSLTNLLYSENILCQYNCILRLALTPIVFFPTWITFTLIFIPHIFTGNIISLPFRNSLTLCNANQIIYKGKQIINNLAILLRCVFARFMHTFFNIFFPTSFKRGRISKYGLVEQYLR